MITLYLMVTLATGQSVVFQEMTDTYMTCRSIGQEMVKAMTADDQFIDAEFKCVAPESMVLSRLERRA